MTARNPFRDIPDDRDESLASLVPPYPPPPRRQSGFRPIAQRWRHGPICRHPSHNPPGMIVVPEGQEYVHVCPGCGKETVIGSTNQGTLSSAAVPASHTLPVP